MDEKNKNENIIKMIEQDKLLKNLNILIFCSGKSGGTTLCKTFKK